MAVTVHELAAKWRREAAEYPVATDARAHAAAVAVRLCADELLDALRAALAPAPTCGTWQPIETAPQDGTAIMCGWFSDDQHAALPEPVRFVDGHWFQAGCWDDRDADQVIPPTHWMPLPDPPTEPTR